MSPDLPSLDTLPHARISPLYERILHWSLTVCLCQNYIARKLYHWAARVRLREEPFEGADLELYRLKQCTSLQSHLIIAYQGTWSQINEYLYSLYCAIFSDPCACMRIISAVWHWLHHASTKGLKLRCIKAWDVQVLSQKYGVTKLLVSEECFEIQNSELILWMLGP